ncbi:MAG: site-specific integrase, partial [Caldimonas sp.]
SASIDRFVDALWIEDGLSNNTLAAYRRDLRLYGEWLARSSERALDASRCGCRRASAKRRSSRFSAHPTSTRLAACATAPCSS